MLKKVDTDHDLFKIEEDALWESISVEQFLEPVEAVCEFRKLEERILEQDADAVECCRILWEKLTELKQKNPLLPAETIVIKETEKFLKQYVFQRTYPLDTERQLLEQCLEAILAADLSEQYRGLVYKFSEHYLRKNAEKIYEEYDSPAELFLWPEILKRKESIIRILIKKLDKKNKFQESANKLKGFIEKTSLPEISAYLKKHAVNLDWLGVDRKAEAEVVEHILEKARCYHTVQETQEVKEADFDRIHVELLQVFPDYSEEIFYNIMLSPLGGVAGLSALYKALDNRIVSAIELEQYEYQMSQAVRQFFEEYHMGRADRRAIRQEQEFLKKIGVRISKLLR